MLCFKFQKKTEAIVYFCLSVFIFIFVFAGLTTPIVGALVRYKTPALPFMLIFIFMMVTVVNGKSSCIGKVLN